MITFDRTQSSVAIDHIDQQIIEHMSADARCSMANIGRIVHLSRAAVHARILRLQQTGLITGSTVTVDYSKIVNLVSAVILVGVHHSRYVEAYEQLKDMPRVTYCALLTGSANIIVIVRYNGTAHSYVAAIECVKNVPGVTALELLPILSEHTRPTVLMGEASNAP